MAPVVLLGAFVGLPGVAAASPLCTTTFLPSTGDWSAGANWSAGVVPSAYDTACVPANAVVSVSSGTAQAAVLWAPDAKVLVTGSSLTLSDVATASQLRDLTVSGSGTLTGAATLDVSGIFDWTGGTMSGSGSTVLQSAATGTLHGSLLYLAGRTLRNDGTLSWPSGTLLNASGVIDNRGTFHANSQDTYNNLGMLSNGSADTRFLNTGTVDKSTGTGITHIGLPFDNDGVVSGTSGELSFDGGGVAGQTATGSWDAASKVTFWSGSFTLGSDVDMSGTFVIVGSVTAASVQAPHALVYEGGQGVLTLTDSAHASHVRDLTLVQNATLTGAGAVYVSGAFDWSGGSLTGSGATVLETGATGTLHGPTSPLYLANRTLRNDGTLSWPSGTLLVASGLIDNRGTFRANSQDTYNNLGMLGNGAADTRFSNTGTVVKSVGTGTTRIDVPFDNDGVVRGDNGDLMFSGGGGSGQTATGSWDGSGSRITFYAGSYTLGSAIEMSGLIVNYASVTAASVQAPDAMLYQTGTQGIFTLSDPIGASQVRDLTLANGTIAGSGRLNVSRTLDWFGGSMTGSGSTVLQAGATGTLHGPTSFPLMLMGRTLRNDATITWSSGTVFGDAGALIDNRGTFRANSEDTYNANGIYGNEATGTRFSNTGTVVKSSGSGATLVSIPFDNNGAVAGNTGDLTFGKGGVPGQTATGSWDGPSRITFRTGSFALGSNIQMSGTIITYTNITAASVQAPQALIYQTAGGTLTLTDATTPSRVRDFSLVEGTLTGAGALSVSGTLDWSGGTMSGTGNTTLEASSTGTIHAGPWTPVTLYQRVLINRGTLTWSAAGFSGQHGAVLDNSGTFRVNSEDSQGMTVGGDAIPTLINTGTLRKTSGTGTTWIRWALADTGARGPNVGTLQTVGPNATAATAATAQAGAASQAEPNVQRSCTGKPVDCATGNQFEIQTDLAIGGRGLGLQATRTYNSQAAAAATAAGALGYGWTGSYSDHLVISSAYRTATVYNADGSTVVFSDYGAGNYQAPPWVQSTLTPNADGTYSYRLPSQVTLRFASDGRLLSQTDRNDNTTSMTYGAGRLTAVTDPAGRSLTYTYNPDGMIASITDPTGLTVNYTYVGGNLTGISYSGISGTHWGFGYDGSHQLTSMTDARGHTTTTAYDSAHRVISQTDALNRTRTWAYGTDETTITNPGGDITHELFENGEPVQITRAQGTPDEATQTLTYHSNRALSTSTDASGRTTTYNYDAAGNRTSVTIPGGRTSTLTYNATRDVTSTTTPSGKTTTFGYDTHGNLTSVTRTLAITGHDPVEQTSTFAYDAAGNQTSATDPLHHTTTFEYDTRGNMTSRTDPLGHTTSWSYDDASRVASVTTPRGHESAADPADFTTTIVRDARGRPIGSTDGLGRHTSTSYDALGNVTSQTDAEGRSTTAVYDAENQVTSTTQPGGGTSHTSYDANGQVTSTSDPNGHTTTYTRDALSRVTTTSDALGHDTTFAYDLSGRMTSQTDPAGRTTSYTYSPAGELTGVDYADPATHDVTYSYDADGQRTSMTDATGQTTFSHDTLGRLTSVTDGENQTVGYGYDLADRQTTVTYPGGDHVTRSYDAGDRVTTISDWLGNTTSYGYDAEDEPTTITYPSSTHDVEQFAYDHAGRATSETITRDGSDRAALSYAYNAADQLTTQTDSGDLTASHGYDYDIHGRLSADGSDALTYDDAGNLTGLRGAALSYDDADRLTSRTQAGDATSYAYDEIGNRTQTAPPTGPVTDYAYDQADQLSSVNDHTASPITYTYDADGLRTTKTKNTQTTHYTWDRSGGLPVLLAKDSTRYVYDAAGLALEQIDSDGSVSYLHHDRLGSTRLVTNADGSTQATYTYDAYGDRTTTSGSSSVPFGYTGQYTDSDTGLIYLSARYYDPATGQFLTQDPLESISGSAYGYAGGDPANHVDPSGLLPRLPFVGGAIDRAKSAARGIGQFAHQVGDTLYNARKEIQLGASVVAAGVCIAASAGTCTLLALGMLAMSATTQVYGHLACGASGSLAGQIAGDVALTLLTMAPAARLARADEEDARLGRRVVGLVNRAMSEIPALGLQGAQYEHSR